MIILVSADDPAFEAVAKILAIDKREVDRVQKAYLAGGFDGLKSLKAHGWTLRKDSFKRRRTTLVEDIRRKIANPRTAPRSQRELAGAVGLSKDHVRKVLKKAALAVPSPYSNEVLGDRIRELLQTQPTKHQRWTYLEAAKALGIDRNRLIDYCQRFGIVFPTKRGNALREQINQVLKQAPKLRPFWTDVELGHFLKVSRVQAKNYRIKFGIELPPHPLEARIRAEMKTAPREAPRWTYLELAHRLGLTKSWVREFCIKKSIRLNEMEVEKA